MTSTIPTYAPGVTYYLPADWVDESLPTLAAAPIDFVEKDEAGQYWLRLPEGDEDRDNEFYKIKLELDHAISWRARRIYGRYLLTVEEDGKGHLALTPGAADANNFCLEDAEDLDTFDDINELIAKGNHDTPGAPLPAGEYMVQAWFWGDDRSFMFEVVGGLPTFREVDHG